MSADPTHGTKGRIAGVDGPRMATTLFAFNNEYLSRKFSLWRLLEEVAGRNLAPGLEIVGFQSIRGFPAIDPDFARQFRAACAQHKLYPVCLGTNADRELRRGRRASDEEMYAYHVPQLQAAATLGFPLIRYQVGAGPEVIRRLVPMAERLNVRMGLEIHAPHHADHPEIVAYREMYAQVRSPYLGWIPDFSATAEAVPAGMLEAARSHGVPESLISLALEIWQGDGDMRSRMCQFQERAARMAADPAHIGALVTIYPMFGRASPASWEPLVPDVIHVHGKFYGFKADGTEESINYPAVLDVFRRCGYRGHIASEWEGSAYCDADAFALVARHQATCRKILGIVDAPG